MRNTQKMHHPDYEKLLLEHVVKPWFPRCIDRVYGGFLVEFDRTWREGSTREKLLEQQARQTLSAAELSIHYPDNPDLAEATVLGFAFLRDVMWDQNYGGWYPSVDREGKPIQSDTKHLHGFAYAIQACFAVHRATGDRSALELGRTAFEWMDNAAHDKAYGGYFSYLEADGTPILRGNSRFPERDHIQTPAGQKDMNVHSDFLETFTYSCSLSDEPLMLQHIHELSDIFLAHYANPDSTPWFYFNADWTPASSYTRPSTSVQTASRLLEARSALPNPAALEQAAIHLIEYAFQHGWNKKLQGLLLAYFVDKPISISESDNICWWAQIEALKALTYGLVIRPDFRLAQQMLPVLEKSFLEDFIDWHHGGIYDSSPRRLRGLHKFLPTRTRILTLRKAGIWKDSSHEARAFLRLLSPLSPST